MEAVTVRQRMGNPRYVPRTYAAEPGAFGKAATIQWNPVESGAEDQHRAAQLQHAWAVEIKRAADRRHGSLSKYAEAAGLKYDRLAKVMRGVEIMRLEDIATAERLLGVRTPKGADTTGGPT